MDLSEIGDQSARRHPWEVARSRFFLRVLEGQGVLRSDRPILDVGSGDAWFAQELSHAMSTTAAITCWDINYAEATSTDHQGLVLTAERPKVRFGGILMLDVVEHVEHDGEFVRGIVDDLLEVDGWALVSVPAYQHLFTAHDTALQHFRRYSPAQMRAVLEAAGLRPVLEGGLFQSLLAVRVVQAARERILAPKPSQGIGGWQGGDLVTRGLTEWLDLEGRLSIATATRTGRVLPGLSYWCFCVPSER